MTHIHTHARMHTHTHTHACTHTTLWKSVAWVYCFGEEIKPLIAHLITLPFVALLVSSCALLSLKGKYAYTNIDKLLASTWIPGCYQPPTINRHPWKWTILNMTLPMQGRCPTSNPPSPGMCLWECIHTKGNACETDMTAVTGTNRCRVKPETSFYFQHWSVPHQGWSYQMCSGLVTSVCKHTT